MEKSGAASAEATWLALFVDFTSVPTARKLLTAPKQFIRNFVSSSDHLSSAFADWLFLLISDDLGNVFHLACWGGEGTESP